MLVRLYAVACTAFGSLLLGGSGIAVAGDPSGDPYGGGQPDGSYSTPDSTDHPDAAHDDAAPPPQDEAGPAPEDHGGDAGAAPPPSDQPE